MLSGEAWKLEWSRTLLIVTTTPEDIPLLWAPAIGSDTAKKMSYVTQLFICILAKEITDGLQTLQRVKEKQNLWELLYECCVRSWEIMLAEVGTGCAQKSLEVF